MTYEDFKEAAKELLEGHEGHLTIQDVMEMYVSAVWILSDGSKKKVSKYQKIVEKKYPEIMELLNKEY